MHRALGSTLCTVEKQGLGAQESECLPGEVEAGGLEIQGHAQLYHKFEINLGYLRPYHKTKGHENYWLFIWDKV